MYSPIRIAKELWESSKKKYNTNDAGLKKFVISRFMEFKMIDSKVVMSQVQKLQIILHEIHEGKMVLSESFQVATIIEKLPPS